MENYPSNSHKSKREAQPEKKPSLAKKQVEKVVTGEVARRKKPLGKRFTEMFVGGDARSASGFVLFDIVIPSAKDMISEAGSKYLDHMLYGEVRPRERSSRSSRRESFTSYNRMSSIRRDREEPRRELSRRARETHSFDEIILETRVEAEEVLESLFNVIAEYEEVTVADLYKAVGEVPDFTDEKWGWTDLRGAGATRVRGGYLLDLPKPVQLD